MGVKFGALAAAACTLAASQDARSQVGASLVPGEQTADFVAPALARAGLFQRDDEVGVLQRDRPEYDTPPIPLGSLNLTPSLTAGLGYDDNVFARTQGVSDAVAIVAPQFLLESDWARNEISAFGRASSQNFIDHSSESEVDWALGGNGRLDIASNSGASGGLSFEQDTEPRTSPSTPVNAATPVRFTVAKAYIGGVQQFNRLRLSGQLDVRDYSYDNPTAIGGGSIYERDRSRTEPGAELEAEYAVTPAASIFVDAIGNHRSFRDQLARNPSRTSSGYDVTVGSNFELTRLVQGQVQVGYLEQDYVDSRFSQVGGLSIRGYVRYFPTRLVTLTVSGSRAVQDAEVAGSQGYLASIARVRADYELVRQLIISAEINYEDDDFRGIDRNDGRPGGLLEGQYLVNRHIGIDLAYEHLDQRSSGTFRGVNYDVNRTTASLTYKF